MSDDEDNIGAAVEDALEGDRDETREAVENLCKVAGEHGRPPKATGPWKHYARPAPLTPYIRPPDIFPGE